MIHPKFLLSGESLAPVGLIHLLIAPTGNAPFGEYSPSQVGPWFPVPNRGHEHTTIDSESQTKNVAYHTKFESECLTQEILKNETPLERWFDHPQTFLSNADPFRCWSQL
jgi:hypothetical protein